MILLECHWSSTVYDLPLWASQALSVLLILTPYVLWLIFCLWAINWKKLTPYLKEGAWIPATLVVVLAAVVWSQIKPSDMTLLGVFTLGNFWWQLTALAGLAALALFAGWVQHRYDWAPAEIAVEPPAHGHGHEHDHSPSHGHDHSHDHSQTHAHGHDHSHH